MSTNSPTLFGATTRANAKQMEDAPSAGRTLLESCEITPALPQKLATRPDGRPLTPVQLAMAPKNAQPATLAQQAHYLASPQPIGGHEAAMNVMRDAVIARAIKTITDTLAAEHQSLAQPLREAHDAALKLRAGFEVDLSDLRGRFEEADKRLRRYQDEAARSAAGATNVVDFAKRLIGNYVKLTEAIKSFNDRELLTLKCDGQRCALEVVAQIAQVCDRLLGGLDATRAAALAGAQDALGHAAQIERESAARGRIADHVVAAERVIAGVCAEGSDTPYIPELIADARDNGSANLVRRAQHIAERVVRAQLDLLDIIELIRREAAATPARTNGGKPMNPSAAPLLVGAHVLDAARRKHAGIRLTGDARPREFTVQVFAGQQPIFAHPNLIGAAYRKPQDEFAFLSVRTDIALDELQLIRDGERDFRDALLKREYFIVEEVARAWRPGAEAQAAASAASAASAEMPGEPAAEMDVMTPSLNGNAG